MPQQPNFNIGKDTNAIAGTDFDSMSSEDLRALINAAHKVKTGRQGRVAPEAQPMVKRHVDIDALIKQYGGE